MKIIPCLSCGIWALNRSTELLSNSHEHTAPSHMEFTFLHPQNNEWLMGSSSKGWWWIQYLKVLKILTSLKYKYLETSSTQIKYLKHTSETVRCSYVNFFLPFSDFMKQDSLPTTCMWEAQGKSRTLRTKFVFQQEKYTLLIFSTR